MGTRRLGTRPPTAAVTPKALLRPRSRPRTSQGTLSPRRLLRAGTASQTVLVSGDPVGVQGAGRGFHRTSSRWDGSALVPGRRLWGPSPSPQSPDCPGAASLGRRPEGRGLLVTSIRPGCCPLRATSAVDPATGPRSSCQVSPPGIYFYFPKRGAFQRQHFVRAQAHGARGPDLQPAFTGRPRAPGPRRGPVAHTPRCPRSVLLAGSAVCGRPLAQNFQKASFRVGPALSSLKPPSAGSSRRGGSPTSFLAGEIFLTGRALHVRVTPTR